mgnify:CR=1 FL=1
MHFFSPKGNPAQEKKDGEYTIINQLFAMKCSFGQRVRLLLLFLEVANCFDEMLRPIIDRH